MYGIHVHEAVIAARDAETGVTIHIVDENYDTGPIIAQTRIPVDPDDTPETLAARVLKIEHAFFPVTLQRIAIGELSLPQRDYMAIKISEFEIASYDNVLVLWKSCEGIGIGASDSRDSIHAYLTRNPGMSFVARSNGIIVGSILGGHDGRRGYIHHLAVHPDFRRQGIGRQLVERVLEVLSMEGILKCHLFIFNENMSGIMFWKSVGWEVRSDIGVISKFVEPAG